MWYETCNNGKFSFMNSTNTYKGSFHDLNTNALQNKNKTK